MTFPVTPSVLTAYATPEPETFVCSALGPTVWRAGDSPGYGTGTDGVPSIGMSLSPSALDPMVVGTAFTQTLVAAHGTTPYTFAVTGGTIPAGLALNTSTGVISGTPTTSGAYSVTVTATDAASHTATQVYTGTVASSTVVVISPTSLPTLVVGTAATQTLTASGGTSPYTWSLSSGSLPAGLSLNTSSGVISGTPSTAGAYSFIIAAVDSASHTGTQAYTGSVLAASTIVISPPSIPALTVATAMAQTYSASGGTPAYTWSISAGSLPAGLSLNSSSGVISGTPTTAGSFSFTLAATDSLSNVGTLTLGGTIAADYNLTITPTTLGALIVSHSMTLTLVASGGTSPYTWAVTSGSLPAGLSLNTSTGVVSGTPTTAGSYGLSITATDATVSHMGVQAYSGTVAALATIYVTPTILPALSVGAAMTQALAATGGTSPYTWAVTSGSLPAGLTLSGSTGVIAGTPTTAGAYVFTVTATDSLSNAGSTAYTGTVSPQNNLTIAPPTLNPMQTTVYFTQTLTASGGTSPYTWSVISGSLPPGISLNASTGEVSGTPTTTGTYMFTVKALDVTGNHMGTRGYTCNVTDPIVIHFSLGMLYPSSYYYGLIYATGGYGAGNFVVTSGSLPTGIYLESSGGVLGGVWDGIGSYAACDITSTDFLGNTATASMLIPHSTGGGD